MRAQHSIFLHPTKCAGAIRRVLEPRTALPTSSQSPYCRHNSYFQITSRSDLDTGNVLELRSGGTTQTFTIKTDFIPYEITTAGNVTAEIVFVGYGITAPEYKYDDYEGIDVAGKIVIALSHEPRRNDTTSTFFEGKKLTRFGQTRHKVENAAKHGAKAILIATEPLTSKNLKPQGFPWPALNENVSPDALPLTLVDTKKQRIPALNIGEDVVRALLGTEDSLRSLESAIDIAAKPHSFPLEGKRTLHVLTRLKGGDITVKNVVGMIEGSETANEYVIMGAHYDHVGILKGAKPDEDSIYNGADDNASGTTGLIEIARAFSNSPKPKRSILFIAFSGEEKGLFGSRAYVANPLVPNDEAVTMLNMDMIGRNDPDSLSIGGNTRCPELTKINEEENLKVGFTLAYDIEHFFFRSDQASFAMERIPVLFYFTGDHADYHKVSDSPDKINFDKLVRVSRLIYRTAWRVANMKEILPRIPAELAKGQ